MGDNSNPKDITNKIFRNLPVGYNSNEEYLERRNTIYNPPPITNNRISSTYYGIKNELTPYQIIDIINKIVSKITYFTYNNDVYKFDDLPWKTLYMDKDKKLISDQKLFSSTQKNFIDEHIKSTLKSVQFGKAYQDYNKPTTITNSPDGGVPITASFFISKELSGLKRVKYKDLNTEHQRVLKMLFYFFIIKLNIEVKKSDFDLPHNQSTNFFITDYQIIRIQYHKELNLLKYTFMVEIYRENKHNGFTIYNEMYFRPEKTEIWISKSELIGVVSQDQIVFKDFGTYNFKEKNVNHAFPIISQDESILDNLYQKMLDFNYRENNRKSTSYDIQQIIFELNNGHKCFKPDGMPYPDAQSHNACLSIDPKVSKTGVWDKECSRDDECPFFQANKNYPNNFGGCKNGYCELPVGMNRIGFKHYDKSKPMCYNCKLKTETITADGYSIINDRECSGLECNKCCDIQHSKAIYPNLQSPDFVFENDQTERTKHKDILIKNGLGVDSLIIR